MTKVKNSPLKHKEGFSADHIPYDTEEAYHEANPDVIEKELVTNDNQEINENEKLKVNISGSDTEFTTPDDNTVQENLLEGIVYK